MYFLASVLLGLIPEVLYFTLFITCTKNIKEKRVKLFLLLSIAYMICVFIQKWQVLYYLSWIALVYLAIKFLYKDKVQIIDVFIISLAYLWLMLLSLILINFAKRDFSNYAIMYIIQRILLFIPFIFKNKFYIIYKKYCSLWNRNDKEKRPIKSITLRNISLILLNVFIFLMSITFINIMNFLSKVR